MHKPAHDCIMFVGPTLNGIEALRRLVALPVECLPPARRGDVDALVARAAPGHVAIVDGTFHMFPAVGHAEIRTAIQRGWTVWGLSSMGAIRASEMRNVGMRGYGTVYDRYVREDDFRDDEVALLHGIDPPYRTVSEPLIHMRAAIQGLLDRRAIHQGDADAVIEDLSSMWFGYRTLSLLMQTLRRQRPDLDHRVVDDWIRGFDRFRLKSLDLLNFLVERPWRHSS
jgi:hypothetical protein